MSKEPKLQPQMRTKGSVHPPSIAPKLSNMEYNPTANKPPDPTLPTIDLDLGVMEEFLSSNPMDSSEDGGHITLTEAEYEKSGLEMEAALG
ncbi:hypothetical protein Nepgr_031196 [Nepenthes gracilis]|uniref:Uncharacterized protein n=1 Tax=Nepenthes gracilis TaxID=150966 RepID=A0AAD3Y4Y0_NEPGR|nr:hypothetical protein Nepgr_031196 [Nepenthes gracilis]